MKKHTLKLVLRRFGVTTSSVEVVAETTSSTEADDQGKARLGHCNECEVNWKEMEEVLIL